MSLATNRLNSSVLSQFVSDELGGCCVVSDKTYFSKVSLALCVFVIVCLTLRSFLPFCHWAVVVLKWFLMCLECQSDCVPRANSAQCLYVGRAEQPSSDDIPDVLDIRSRRRWRTHQTSDRPVHLWQCGYGCNQLQAERCLSIAVQLWRWTVLKGTMVNSLWLRTLLTFLFL